MKKLWRISATLLFLAVMTLGSRGLRTAAQSRTLPRLLPRSPLSGGLLMAKAIHSGLIQLTGPVEGAPSGINLTCSKAPCAFTPVQASEGGQPVDEDPIATNPANASQLLTGGNDYNCGSLQGFYTTNDGGSTWTHTCMNTLAGAVGDGDPGVAYNGRGTAVIDGIDSLSNGSWVIAFETSTNNGSTWSLPAVAVNALFPGGITDKPWLAIDTGRASPYKNYFYISNTMFDTANNTEIGFTRSSNGGKNWTTVGIDTEQLYPNIDQFSDFVTGPDGTIYATWMRCTANGTAGDCGGTVASMMFSKSTNAGATWSTPVTMATPNLAPDACFCAFYGSLPNTSERVSDIPVIGINPKTSMLTVAMYNWTGTQMQVEAVHSTDGGTTWSVPVAVSPAGTHDQFFPWLSVNSSGVIGVTWLDRRNDPANISYQPFVAFSKTATSFLGNRILNTKLSDPFNDGFGGAFMGDYSGNIWSGNSLYASWMDTSNGVNTQDDVGGFLF
jgi:hypothetical protein